MLVIKDESVSIITRKDPSEKRKWAAKFEKDTEKTLTPTYKWISFSV